jgi:2-keto-4-pentenoate hydratase/2-oxohepta-3-ene-1,7-dioic acid hydratase in catechol pathway
MRFATLQTVNGPRAALAHGAEFLDLHATDAQLPNSVRAISAALPVLRERLLAVAANPNAVRVAPLAYLPPILDPRKILCIGLNYRDHAIEGGKAIPTEPVLFGKFCNTLIGHGAPIYLPAVSKKVDYEAELVIVIGKPGRYIPKESALEYVAGYTIGHDVSARDWQFRGEEKQWIIGKTFDTFAPTGPVVVTTDEVPDPHQLHVELKLNGKVLQSSNTKEFIFSVGELLAYVSQVITLEPGDLIFTGTPPGVGAARKPPIFLQPGDVAEVTIEHLGTLRNPVQAEPHQQ